MDAEAFALLRERIRSALLAESASVLDAPSRWERRVRVREAVARLLERDGLVLAPRDASRLVGEIADTIVGLGPLEQLLRDPAVTEVMVNGPERVYVERDGRIERVSMTLEGDAAVRHLIDRVVAPLGLHVDESRPWVDARLPDGSRVHAIIPPLAVSGPTLTIRRFSRRPMSGADLIGRGTLDEGVLTVLRDAVIERKNLLISGGAGAGKTTLLGVLSGFIPTGERIITIEDAAELRLAQEHVVSLETRPPNIEGRGEVSVRDLVRNALRMRPDRIVVGEVRGAEAFDMLQAMNTGHTGSMSTIHANGARDALARLEAMVLMAATGLPLDAVREQISCAIHLIVHMVRSPAGSRRVTEVLQICGLAADELVVAPALARPGELGGGNGTRLRRSDDR
ncbi:MAG: CpaF family protein [Actinomycetota bacterium]